MSRRQYQEKIAIRMGLLSRQSAEKGKKGDQGSVRVPLWPILLAIVVIAVLAYAVYDGSRRIVRRNADVENALAQKKLDDEIARRRRTQYAKVAFLKARPEAAFVSMEGKRL